jgi:hypothetical protein
MVEDNKTVLKDNRDAFAASLKENREEVTKALQQSRDAMNADLAQNKTSLDASAEQAKAVVNTNITSSHNDQRAWISISGCELLSREPNAGEGLTVRCHIQNTGKTPAVRLTHYALIGLSDVEPAVPDWKNQAVHGPPETIFPGDPTSRSYDESLDIPTGTGRSNTLLAINLYRQSMRIIYVRERFTYDDVFGRAHYTNACYSHAFGRPLNEFKGCSTANDVDTDPPN